MAPSHSNLFVCRYSYRPAAYYEYDSRAPRVAALIKALIEAEDARLAVEHIGSTAVPGCGGKGIIDLLLLYEDGQIDAARAVLKRMGFQRHTGSYPFPQDRPMRVAAVRYDGTEFPVHVHLLVQGSPEIEMFRTFRDHLRADPRLIAAYTARKRAIIASELTDRLEYTEAKGVFCRQVLEGSAA